MDYGTYLSQKMRATNNFKSNWQPRDASEVTMRNRDIANTNITSTHKGPDDHCVICTIPTPLSSTNAPNNGFSTDYSSNPLTLKKAGGTHCQDPNWGTAGGVNLKTPAEIAYLSILPLNPVKSTGGGKVANDQALSSIVTTNCYCADPGVPFHPIKNPLRVTLPSG